jgi:putative chitinase
MNVAQFQAIFPGCKKDIVATCDLFNATCVQFDIGTPLRIAAFAAQLGHECGDFRYKEEIADGSAYEGRKDLGNVNPGDGKRYKGRGPLMLTGRRNYTDYGNALGLDLVGHPEKVAELETGLMVAGLYWKKKNLNEVADIPNFDRITKLVNGGYNGKSDRDMRYARAKKALGI